MPGFDGTGPLGKGPMTGGGQGFCVLINLKENPGQVKGIAGLQGVPVGQVNENHENSGKKVINMPFRDGTGPAGAGPMTGRAAGFCAGYPTPGYMNPTAGKTSFYGVGARVIGPYGTGYGMSYVGRVNSWFRRGFAFGFGRGLGRGRGWGRGRGGGRFGFRW